MKKNTIFASFILLTFCHFQAVAGGGTGWLNVTQIYAYSSGVVRVFVSPAHTDPDNCGSTSVFHIAVDANKNMYAAILTAFTANKTVSFYISGCLTESGTNAPKITRVAIK